MDVAFVRALLAEQQPELASLPLALAGYGIDNFVYRLGEAWLVRLPRSEAAAQLLENELRWLPALPPLPVPIPTPRFRGRAQEEYAWPWYVAPWIDGQTALSSPPADLTLALGGFVRALHQPAPHDAPLNPHRGGALATRHARFEEHLALSDGWLTMQERDALRARWVELMATPPWMHAPCWLHGDLHPGNLLVRDGALAGVIDFGDLCAGDPATDLAVAWMLLEPRERSRFRAHATRPDDDALWRRAQGWALALGLACLTGAGIPHDFRPLGLRTLRAALA